MFLGINMFLALLRAHFNPRYPPAKMILDQKHLYARERQLYCYIKFKIVRYHFAANLSASPHLIR